MVAARKTVTKKSPASDIPKDAASSWEKILDALSLPLPEEAVERTSGSKTGKGYDTTGYKYQYVVNRFNEVLGINGWSYTYDMLEKHEYKTSSGKDRIGVTVNLELTLKCGEETNTKALVGGHDSNNYADALKGAITNALKKTAAMFGNGKSAYEVTIDDDNTPEGADRGQVATTKKVTGGRKASEKQVGMINALLSKGGWDREKFKKAHKLESMKDLTVSQASDFIDRLQKKLEQKANAAPEEPTIQMDEEEAMSDEEAASLVETEQK